MSKNSDEKKQFNLALGALLTCYLKFAGIEQLPLAKLLGVNQSTMSRMLSGQSPFDCWQLRTVAQKLAIDLDVFYHDVERVVTRTQEAMSAIKANDMKAFAAFAVVTAGVISKEA